MSIINSFLDTMASLASQSGFAGFLVDGGWKNIVMILISFVFMYLAIAKGFEPLLLLPISFGMLLTNLPYAEMYHPDFWNYKTVAGNDHYIDYGQILQKGGLLDILYMGVKLQIYPPLIFLGIGAMTDFGPLIASPKSFLMGAAAQGGIFFTFIGAALFGMSAAECGSIAIIGVLTVLHLSMYLQEFLPQTVISALVLLHLQPIHIWLLFLLSSRLS